MSHLEQARAQQAADHADDILLAAHNSRAVEAAHRVGVPLFIALRVLVPHYTRTMTNTETALRLGVSKRTVERHRAIARQQAAA